MDYGHRAGRVQNQISRRVRNASRRLEELERTRVAQPAAAAAVRRRGPGGAGKSTLLGLLAGRLSAEGEVRKRRGLTVGLLTQDTVFERPERAGRDT